MSKRKRITSHEVAERAGVSRSTVSLILNNTPGVNFSAATRLRVVQAANELGYVPDESARSLASGKTRNIGLIICQQRNQYLSDAYIPNVIYGINEVAAEHGLHILIDWVEDVTQPGAYLNLALARKIDGILLILPRTDDEQLPVLIGEGFPIVVLDRFPDLRACWVSADDRAATQQAVEHLLRLGHRHVGCITNGPLEHIVASERLNGYRQALQQAGIAYDGGLVACGAFTPESGYQAMQTLLNHSPQPTAAMVASDVVAFGAMAAIHDRGLRIPDDIAIVSIDDIAIARYACPPLTTIRLSAPTQGRFGMMMLIDLIRGERPVKPHVLLAHELVIRQSCGANRKSP